ncbi:TPA: hypothetical protein U1W09_000012 [Streptococcus suis]|nr:hypothetical protein [Streptococcus suis]HEM4065499.1 hypothetical protein [Streptococcus suis]
MWSLLIDNQFPYEIELGIYVREYKVDSSARLKVLGSEGSFVTGSIPAVPVHLNW